MALEPETGQLLTCGRDPVNVTDQARTGQLDPHEATCPYCAKVIADAATLHRAAQAVAAQPVTTPYTLLPALMRDVRAQPRPSLRMAIPSSCGPAAITETALGNALRFTLDRLPGLRIRSIRASDATPDPDRGTANRADPAAPDISVHLSLSLAYNSDLAATIEQVRVRVIDACQANFGLPIRRVDLTVVDIYSTGGEPR